MFSHSEASERATTASDWLVVAHVEYFVGDARLYEDEVAGTVVERPCEARAVLVANTPRQDVEHHLEVDVDVSFGHPTGRDGGDVHRESFGAHVLLGHPDSVPDAVPLAAVVARPKHRDPVTDLDVPRKIEVISHALLL